MIDALLPVGRDCDCGCPLVWRQGQQWCSVWGSHPYYPRIGSWKDAPGADLIRAVMDCPNMTRNATRLRAQRQLKAVS